MVKLNLETAHRDERGSIVDLIVNRRIDAITHLTMVKGAVRGNHFHKETTQWTFVVFGEITYAEQTENNTLATLRGVRGDLFVSNPGVVHAVRAESDSEVLVFTSGPRAGESYEKDTYRVSPSIIE